jgi:CspA family cold shock protein
VVFVVAVGTLLRFDEVRGYGFIAPQGGGEDVFVHANDFGEDRRMVQPGARVEYEVAEGDRGLKVSTVRLLDAPSVRRPFSGAAPSVGESRDALGDEDGVCDVLSAKTFGAAVTELLIDQVPTLTGAQISQVRQRLLVMARSHGWVES